MHDHPHHHNFSYNEEERRKRQNPEQILKDIGLGGGMVFIDLGSNDGFFTLPAAKIVGLDGGVYAVDVNELAIDKLNNKLNNAGITNFQTVVAKAENTVFADGIADIIFLGTVLHDFEDPLKVLQNAKRMLKENGKLVNLDWRAKVSDIGPPLEIRFSKSKATNLIEAAGLRVMRRTNYTDDYYIIEAAKR